MNQISSPAGETGSEWIDLSHPIDVDVAKVPFLPKPSMQPVEDASLRATEINIVTHVGTHVESPLHLFEFGKSIDEYPVERWISRGLVCEVDAEPLTEIELDELEPPAAPEPGDALLVRTGWEERVGEESYYEQPYLSREIAEWAVEQSLSWVGIDSPSPEMPVQLRDDDFNYPVHGTLLANDIPIIEHLTDLKMVANETVEVIALPLSYVDIEGSQVRVIARL